MVKKLIYELENMSQNEQSLEGVLLDKMLDVIMEAAQGNYHAQASLSGTNDAYDALAMGINMMIDDIRTGVEKIQNERDFTNNIISSITDLIVVMNVDQRIILINEAGVRLLGFSHSEEILGKHINEFFEDPLFNNMDVREERYIENAERYILTRERKEIPVLFSTSILRDKQGTTAGIIGIAKDITDKHKSEEKAKEYMINLEKMNKELDQFAYVVSHDLKAPLRAIANLSQWIEEDLGPSIPEDIKKNMDTLRGRVHRMEALINGILSYSRSTRPKVEITSIDLEQLLKDIIAGLVVPAKFSVTIAHTMPVIHNNKVWIEQIFTNLISNAIKHNDKIEGKVEISYKDGGGYHQFAVTDNGPGIAEEYHEKVFTIFQTLEARDKVENTGVGLSIVKKIIEEQKGKIWIESQVGHGTSFVFHLPKQYKTTSLKHSN